MVAPPKPHYLLLKYSGVSISVLISIVLIADQSLADLLVPRHKCTRCCGKGCCLDCTGGDTLREECWLWLECTWENTGDGQLNAAGVHREHTCSETGTVVVTQNKYQELRTATGNWSLWLGMLPIAQEKIAGLSTT